MNPAKHLSVVPAVKPSAISGMRPVVSNTLLQFKSKPVVTAPIQLAPMSNYNTPPELMFRGVIVALVPAMMFWTGLFFLVH